MIAAFTPICSTVSPSICVFQGRWGDAGDVLGLEYVSATTRPPSWFEHPHSRPPRNEEGERRQQANVTSERSSSHQQTHPFRV
jgi:hypothetical protein